MKHSIGPSLMALLFGLVGCEVPDDPEVSPTPTDPGENVEITPRPIPCENAPLGFPELRPDEQVFDVVLEDPASYFPGAELNEGGRLLMDDLDGDGDLDLGFGHHGRPPTLFRNLKPDGVLVDPPADLPSGLGPITTFAAVDLDDDALPELVLAHRNGVSILDNHGDFDFSPARILWERPDHPRAQVSSLSAGDLDGDGDLDLLVVQTGFPGEGDEAPAVIGMPLVLLMMEDGAVEQAVEILPGGDPISSLVGVVTDSDRDGSPELLVFSDGNGPGAQLVQQGDGWVDEGAERFADLEFDGMGASSGDVNGDGWLDWCVSDFGPPVCFLSFGGMAWYTGSAAWGLTDGPDMPGEAVPSTLGWGMSLADLDNDGFVDLLQTGAPSNELSGLDEPPPAYEDRVWAGGTAGFSERTEVAGFGDWRPHLGVAAGDLSGDGALEVVVAGPSAVPVLYRNRCIGGGFVQVDLEGPSGNRRAVGAQVVIRADDRPQVAEVGTGHGPNQAPARLHFGFKVAETADRVDVYWPDGTTTERE